MHTKVKETNTRVDSHDMRFEILEAEIQALEEQLEHGGRAISAGSKGQHPDGSLDGKARLSVPINRRWSVVVGGFDKDTSKDVIEMKLREITDNMKQNISDQFCPGKFSSVGIIVFKGNKLM